MLLSLLTGGIDKNKETQRLREPLAFSFSDIAIPHPPHKKTPSHWF